MVSTRYLKHIKKLISCQSGITAIEYSVLFASIFLVAIASVTDVRTTITDTFSCLIDKARGTASGACASQQGTDDFQNFDLGNNWLKTTAAGSKLSNGWTVSSGTVDMLNGKHWSIDGKKTNDFIDMHGTSPGTISKTIATVIGQEYTVSFDYAKNPNASISRTIEFSAGGTTANAIATSSNSWTNKTVTFKATSNSTTLSFKSLNTQNANWVEEYSGAYLDNIQVKAK